MPLGNSLAILKSLANSIKGRMVENFLPNPVISLIYRNNFLYFIEGRSIKKTDLNKNIIDIVIDPKFNNVKLDPTVIDVDESGDLYFGDSIDASMIPEHSWLNKVDNLGNISQVRKINPEVFIFYNKSIYFENGLGAGNGAIDTWDFKSYFSSRAVGNLNSTMDFAFNSKGDMYVANHYFNYKETWREFSRLDIATRKTDGSYNTVKEWFRQGIFISAICFDKDDNLFFAGNNAIYKVYAYKVGETPKFEVIAGKHKQSGDIIGYWENARFGLIKSLAYVNTGSQEILYIATSPGGIKRIIL